MNDNYDNLKAWAKQFLVDCGRLTIVERTEQGEVDPQLSANEMLGMATRILAEVADEFKEFADAEEAKQ